MRYLKLLLIILLCVDLFLIYIYLRPQNSSKNETKIETNKNNKIEVHSESKKIEVSLKSIALLEKKLNDADFWGANRIALYDSEDLVRRVPQTAQRVIVVVSDKPQSFQQFTTEQGGKTITYQSYNVRSNSSGIITITVNISPELVDNYTEKELTTQFEVLILHAVYNVTHPVLSEMTDPSERYENLNPYLEENQNIDFLTISKK